MVLTEAQIQASIVKWFNNSYCLKSHVPRGIIFSVPNGGKRHKLEAVTLQATGTLAGVSDLIIIFRGHVLFVEVKTGPGGQSLNQMDFEHRIKKNGFDYHIVRSLEDFQKIIVTLPQN